MERGDAPAGFRHIQQAAEIDPGFKTPKYAQAVKLYDAGDVPEAVALFEQIADSDVDDIAYHVGLGSDLYRRGMYSQAIQEYGKALALNDRYADVHNQLAVACNADGQPIVAAEHLRRALEINPKYLDARLNLALTLETLGKTEESRTEFAEVLKLDPENTLAKERAGA